ncbi:hypothetical protein KFE25_000174 [Diacronema lutheri]|uniref:Uncharacterized protein n=1 Tax=Diacronema lutheri TaxID=2081491 RepID=A0A8J5X955_DIALT|nr:hypothetical protein KFE25_000174 [Diacronema lutheri]
MEIPLEEPGRYMSHAAHVEFGARMARRTVNVSFYARDIEGAQAGTRKRIKPRSRAEVTNPANPIYQPLERPTMGAREHAEALAADAERKRELEAERRRPAARSELEKLLSASNADLARRPAARERRHFRRTNYVGDIAGTQALTGVRMAEGTLSRRQLNPLEPAYDWGRARSGDVVASTATPGPRLAQEQPRRPPAPAARRAPLEAHIGPGMTLVLSRSSDLVHPQVQRATLRAERAAALAPSRSEAFADQMASARSFFHSGTPVGATHATLSRAAALTPPARDPALIVDRSLTTADVLGSMAHKAHRVAAGQPVRQRRTIRDPMVLMRDVDDGAQ